MDVASAPAELAYCGLYCAGCPLFRATHDGTLEAAAAGGVAAEHLRCTGCRTAKVSIYCLNCSMKKCAAGQGVATCADCADFPCRVLRAFDGDGYPPHGGVVESLRALRERGPDVWLAAEAERFRCRGCGRALSHQDRGCPRCGSAAVPKAQGGSYAGG